jgi:hypothetical protein
MELFLDWDWSDEPVFSGRSVRPQTRRWNTMVWLERCYMSCSREYFKALIQKTKASSPFELWVLILNVSKVDISEKYSIHVSDLTV